MSRPRCSEPEADGALVVRCARVAAAVVAVLALRALLSGALVSGSARAARWHIPTPSILIAVALVAGVMWREVGRGLAGRLPRPRWSARFAGTWAGSSGLLLTVLLASAGSHGAGAGVSIGLAVCLGLLLAASLSDARRLLWALTPWRGRIPVRLRASAVPIPRAVTLSALVPAPLLAGWSDRGPPPGLA